VRPRAVSEVLFVRWLASDQGGDPACPRLLKLLAISGSVIALTAAAGVASASPAAKDSRPVLLLLSVDAVASYSKGKLDSIESLLLSALESTNRFHVIGSGDLRMMVDLEMNKQALGCKEDDACMVAIGGALGADYVAAATIGKLGRTTVLALKVIAERSATALVHAQETFQSEDRLVGAADLIAEQVAAALPGATAKIAAVPLPSSVFVAPPAPAPDGTSAVGHTLGIVAVVVGALGLGAGTGLELLARQRKDAFRATPQLPSVESSVNGINTMVTGAIVGWAAGGAIAATGTGLLVAF